MTTLKTIKQKAKITQWGGFSNGIEKPVETLGYIVVERRFKVFFDGNMRLDRTYPEKLVSVNDQLVGCLWSLAALEEFFPGFTGYELEGEA